MKWWKIAAIIGGFVLAVAAVTWLYYGGGEGEDHEIVGYVSGTVQNVDMSTWSFRVGGQTIYVRGRYDCGGTIFYSEDMLTKIAGNDVRIGYSEELGYPVAEKVEVNGIVCTRVPGRGGH